MLSAKGQSVNILGFVGLPAPLGTPRLGHRGLVAALGCGFYMTFACHNTLLFLLNVSDVTKWFFSPPPLSI